METKPLIDVRIRSFELRDATPCAILYRAGLVEGQQIADNDTGLDIDDIPAAYMTSPGSHFWVAESQVDKREIVGMIGVQHHEDNVGEIRRLRVSEGFRRRGIGSQLVETAVRYCKENNYLKIALDTFMEREPAIRLFEKFHFRHSRSRTVGGKEIMHFYLDLYQRERPEKRD
jgi:ribosomal protein S18 acetylase RimI-like enzyme